METVTVGSAQVPPAPPLLEHLETTPRQASTPPSAQRQRPKWEYARDLEEVATTDAQRKRCRAIRECCSDARVYRTPSGLKCELIRCRDHLCPRCQAALSARYQAEIADRVATYSSPKHIVFTLRSSDTPLREQVRRLKSCFARLRRRSTWKALVHRGVYTYELTRNLTTGRWHPHLHVIADARFVPHKWLTAEWLKITGDSPVVHVGRADASTAKYVAKYIAKPNKSATRQWEVWPLEDELKGLHACDVFGHETAIRKPEPPDRGSDTVCVGRLSSIVRWAAKGDPESIQLLRELDADRWLARLRLEPLPYPW